MDILLNVILFVVGVVVGVMWMGISFYAFCEKNNILHLIKKDEDGDKATTPAVPSVLQFTVEVRHNIYYVFNKETNKFITQSASTDEVINHLKTKFSAYPNASFEIIETIDSVPTGLITLKKD